MKQFYLLSLKHSKYQNQYTWWGPNNSGYTTNLLKAGVYTEEQINEKKYYYSNASVMPVPIEVTDGVEKMIVIGSTDSNCKLLGIENHLKTAKEY